MPVQHDVGEPCQAYKDILPAWQMIDALLGGTATMRAKGEVYLPKEIAESDSEYMLRLKRAYLKPALRVAVETAVGRVFQNEVVTDGVAPAVRALLDDVDQCGNDLTTFLARCFFDMLAYGRAHILADHPPMPEGATMADARRDGARPYLVRIDPRSLIGWRQRRGPGPERLEQARFYEYVPAPTGPYDDDTVEPQIRVLSAAGQEVWAAAPTTTASGDAERRRAAASGALAIGVGGDWTLRASYPADPKLRGEVPLTTVYAERTGFMQSRPPFIDLAWLNLAHWQSYSDYRNILHVAMVPFLVARGVSEDAALVVGVSSMTKLSSPESDIRWVEHSGAAIAAGRQELLDLETLMDGIGAASLVVTPDGADKTATEDATDTAERHANIGGLTQALEDGANAALYWLGRLAGVEDAGKVKIERPMSMGGEMPADAAAVGGDRTTSRARTGARPEQAERT